jgi:hypothetical protein
MSEEKTLGKVLWESAYGSGPRRWEDIDEEERRMFDKDAATVIAEFLRRNAEPVAWRFMVDGAWFTGPSKESCERALEKVALSCEVPILPLFAAPQLRRKPVNPEAEFYPNDAFEE